MTLPSDIRKLEDPHAPRAERGSFAECLTRRIGRFDVTGKILLLPDMAPAASRLLAASFRAFGVPARVLPTYRNLELGKRFTSGKECFPCQITLGDLLGYLSEERAQLGGDFNILDYVYFMPEADGPCRFGMYNKMQRLVLDRFPAFKEIPVLYLSTADGYASTGLMRRGDATRFRCRAYTATVVADALDRIAWRVRPYERDSGQTDALLRDALAGLCEAIEHQGRTTDLGELLSRLNDTAATAAGFIDSSQPRKPRIGIVGEIYLRSHPDANQNIVRTLEGLGGEVTDASMSEWINFVAYKQFRNACKDFRRAWRQRDIAVMRGAARCVLVARLAMHWQDRRQRRIYQAVSKRLDIAADHAIAEIEKQLDRDRHFNFDIGTEAALSIGGAMTSVHAGFDGIVNVYPFGCMPSTMTSAILKPLLLQHHVPYLDASYDGAVQPNRDVALRTFMYQAAQHREYSNDLVSERQQGR